MPDTVVADSGEITSHEAIIEQGGTQQEAAVDEIVEIAKAVGWKETGKLDARDFLKTMPGRFHSQTQELKDIKKSVDGITKHFVSTVENQVKERLEKMEAAKEAAIIAGDVSQVKQIDQQIKEVEKTVPVKSDTRPDVDAFVSRNEWFDKDLEMTEVALGFNKAYMKLHPNASDKEVLEYVEKKTKQAFPDKFKEPDEPDEPDKPKPVASAVESPNAQGGATATWQQMKAKMNSFDKDSMADILKQTHNGKPITTEKAYIESLMAAGAFEGRK